MQSRLPVSKPLALIVIGLVIGLSLGLGSGYAIFYPDMVNERSKTVEGRISDVEMNITSLDEHISSVNYSLSLINENIEGILALTDVIEGINSRVLALENGQININGDINDLENQLTTLEGDLFSLENDWTGVLQDFNDLMTEYNALNLELENIQAFVIENDGVKILTAHMANPSSSYEQNLASELYSILISEEPDFADWVALYGENTAKILLQQEVDAVAGSWVWNPTENTEVDPNTYQVKLETYCTIEFSPAKVIIDNMHILVKATVDINDGMVSSLQVTLVEIS